MLNSAPASQLQRRRSVRPLDRKSSAYLSVPSPLLQLAHSYWSHYLLPVSWPWLTALFGRLQSSSVMENLATWRLSLELDMDEAFLMAR